MTFQRQTLHFGAGDAVFGRHVFRGEAHAHIGPLVVFRQPGIPVGRIGGFKGMAHILHAAGDHDRLLPGGNGVGAGGNGLEPGGAEAVDGLAAYAVRQTGALGDETGRVEVEPPYRHGTAHDHVGDLTGIQLRDPVQNAAEHLSRPVDGVRAGQGPFLGTAYGRTAVCYDHCLFGHKIPP